MNSAESHDGQQASSHESRPLKAGLSISVRLGSGTRNDPYHWEEAIVVRLTSTRLGWRHVADPPYVEQGRLRRDCEGLTWKQMDDGS